ncbi:uncharacterized protein LOC103103278 isoform X1 [Monodelphis domestica]|uniref:uncharacterized protein LOC103103278 isoform X1 n=1 Tax=Monodelphis domestica TaxID=13616 RepID=UPI0024E24159|nr:uncharacterized protein LOC103103278 isoform X1 [Monodelphis domestica]
MEATISALKWSKMTKMRMREEGRLKVQPKITRTAFGYLYSVSGILKVLRMLFVFGASIAFIIASVHESYIAILLLESCIVLSFIIIYMLGLHHLLVFILWPAFDILNCILTAGFLVVVGFLVLWEEGTDKYVLGGAILLLVSYSLLKLTKTASVFIPVILVLESSFFFFFIFAYILALPKYLTKLTWPIFDLLNNIFAFLYLSYAGFYSLIHPPDSIDGLYWQICVVILFVALLCLIDVILQTWRLSFRKLKSGIRKSIRK